ncbi:hypothetical protein RC94_00295 [Pectobacterium brasiliense]|nr:hypothetical protein RC79_05590 [Pectobacterium brasiliense]KHT12693.1 hypothetical protein RC94_00295 [Pectobacterium brasiliense]
MLRAHLAAFIMVGEPEGSHKRPDIWLQYLLAFLLKNIAIYGSVHICIHSVFTIYPLPPFSFRKYGFNSLNA